MFIYKSERNRIKILTKEVVKFVYCKRKKKLSIYRRVSWLELLHYSLKYTLLYLHVAQLTQISVVQGDPKKISTHIFLTEIHKFNSSLFFFSGYEVDSVHSIHQHVQKFECTKLELFCFIFIEVRKKFMDSVFFFWGGSPCILQLCLDEQQGIRIYMNIRLYSYYWRWYLFGAEE